MVKYINFFDKLPFVLKLLFALPILDGIFYGIYRIGKGQVAWGIVWLVFGMFLFFVVDIYSILKVGRVMVKANFKA